MRAFITTIGPKTALAAAKASPAAALISLRYFILRFSTAGSALVAGLVQTFVFARVLDPEAFSIFILIGILGLSLWLFDLGLSKILFVGLRARYLAGEDTKAIAGQADALVLLYGFLIASGSVLCFAIMWVGMSTPAWNAAQYSLFFLFSALNLVWFVLRNLSIAIDEFIYFETLEAARRIGHVLVMLATLVGLPFAVFLVAANVMWGLLFALAIARLVQKQALTAKIADGVKHLGIFFRENWKTALRTGAHAAGELYVHNILYLVVPIVFGLGAPTIVLDTTIKIFYGMLMLYTAACDLLVPRQTSAFAERDAPTLVRATLAAAGLCAIPALLMCAVLWFASDRLFALLLGSSATMPPAAAPILAVLLLAAIAKTVSNFLLQHTGFFKELSGIAILVSAAMTAGAIFGMLAGLGLVGFLEMFAAVYAGSALLYLVLAVGGPIHAAQVKS